MHRGARPPSRDHRLRCAKGGSVACYAVTREWVLALREAGEEPDVVALDLAAARALVALLKMLPYGALR